MTSHRFRTPDRRPAPAGCPEKSSWPIPVALMVLSLIPVISGSLRLVEVAGGPQLMPTNTRIDASPAPLVVHVSARPSTRSSAHSSSPPGCVAAT